MTVSSLGPRHMMDISRGTSPGDSNSESSATSPGDTSGTAGRRRTRASKPKVRTGCITWIRRVKCGEEKPACLRCTSTGRKCDGYDSTLAPSRALSSMRAEESQRGAELARQEFLRAYQWNTAMRSLRPIVADIDGTERERRFFHAFRAAAAEGGLTGHVCNYNGFWSRAAPQLAHRDGAVKHAMVALGSAYQLYQQSSDGNWSSTSGSSSPSTSGAAVGTGGMGGGGGGGGSVSSSGGGGGGVGGGGGGSSTPQSEAQELELFTIQQYTKSISLLGRHATSSSPESIRVTLVCCLAFICLETLRSNHADALTHLANGLRILESLPQDSFEFLNPDTAAARTASAPNSRRPSPTPPSPPSAPPVVAATTTTTEHSSSISISISSSSNPQDARDMRDIIRMFCRLECSAAAFASGMRPSLAVRSYDRRRFDDGSALLLSRQQGQGQGPTFDSLADCHAHLSANSRDVVARTYETARHWADPIFWSDPHQQRQQAALRTRSARLGAMLERFARGPAAPRPDTAGFYSLQIDRLHHLACTMFVEGMTGLDGGDDEEDDDDDDDDEGEDDDRVEDRGGREGRARGDFTMGGTGSGSVGASGRRYQETLAEMLGVAGVLAQTARRLRSQHSRGGAGPTASSSSSSGHGGSGVGSSAVSGGVAAAGATAGGSGSGSSSSTPSASALTSGAGPRCFTYDAGMVGPVYLVAVSAADPALRQRAQRLLREAEVREGFWDGPSLHQLIGRVGALVAGGRWPPFPDVPRSLTGLGGIPDMWLAVERLEMEGVERMRMGMSMGMGMGDAGKGRG